MGHCAVAIKNFFTRFNEKNLGIRSLKKFFNLKSNEKIMIDKDLKIQFVKTILSYLILPFMNTIVVFDNFLTDMRSIRLIIFYMGKMNFS